MKSLKNKIIFCVITGVEGLLVFLTLSYIFVGNIQFTSNVMLSIPFGIIGGLISEKKSDFRILRLRTIFVGVAMILLLVINFLIKIIV